MSYWIFGVLATLFGLLGAVLASGAIDIGMFTFGIGLIGFSIVFVYWSMKDAFDQKE
ncbi:MAG TPA: hypothetical protein VET85_17380 [Stellaceae bacterium]|nr:hypothetical protein [Stellaceae bacterium]